MTQQPRFARDQDGCGLTFRDALGTLDLDLVSPHFPGGTLYSALYDRDLMRLSDRGGASGIIGSRWADICAHALHHTPGLIAPLQPETTELVIDHVIRLDDIPAIASQASRLKLQNPDFLLIHEDPEGQHMLAADAKFSIDTAKSRQVSADVVTSLIAMGPAIGRLVPTLRPDATVRNGVFLSPDYSLTRRLLQTRRGLQRVTIADHEVCLIPVDAPGFLESLGHERLIGRLATRDNLPLDHLESLALTLFYLRVARALIGCWLDQTGPLLVYMDTPFVELEVVEENVDRDSLAAIDAWRLVMRWNDMADQTRRQRAAIDHVTALPITGKDLRGRIDLAARAGGVEPPSTNRVRRLLGAWYRERYRERFGPLPPPVDDLDDLLSRLAVFGRTLRPALERKTDEVISDLVSASDLAADMVDADAVAAG